MFTLTDVPFFIGKGSSNRWRSHLNLCKNVSCDCYHTRFYHKLRKMLKTGFRPFIVKVFISSCEQTCYKVEKMSEAGLKRSPQSRLLTTLDQRLKGRQVSKDTR